MQAGRVNIDMKAQTELQNDEGKNAVFLIEIGSKALQSIYALKLINIAIIGLGLILTYLEYRPSLSGIELHSK
jgi:hypothetical protein